MLLQNSILEKKRHLKIFKILIYLIDFSIFNYKNNIQTNKADIEFSDRLANNLQNYLSINCVLRTIPGIVMLIEVLLHKVGKEKPSGKFSLINLNGTYTFELFETEHEVN